MEYSADDIKVPVFDVIDCRSRPSLYVGPIDCDSCVSTMLQEAMCFALQSAIDGTANEILITKHRDGVISVRDNGPDLNPCEMRDGLPVVELLLTQFYACDAARMIDRSNFNFGIVSTNALSRFFAFEITFGRSVWRQEFRYGIPLSKIAAIRDSPESFRSISFVPDDKVIQNTDLSYYKFKEWFDERCGIIHGCKIDYVDEEDGKSFVVADIAR